MWTNCIIFKQRYFCLNTWFSCFLIFQKFDAILRYYAAFKLKKCESLFYKIDTFLQKNYHLHWIASRANFLSKYMIYIFFNFGRNFCSFFSFVISKSSSLFVVKNIWINFCYSVLLYLWAKKGCIRFLKACFKLEILIFFILRGDIFSRYVKKSSVSDEKNNSGEIWDEHY